MKWIRANLRVIIYLYKKINWKTKLKIKTRKNTNLTQGNCITFVVLSVKHRISIIIKHVSVWSLDLREELNCLHKVVEFVVAKGVPKKIESFLTKIKITKIKDNTEKGLWIPLIQGDLIHPNLKRILATLIIFNTHRQFKDFFKAIKPMHLN